MQKRKPKKPVPSFNSIMEASDFWDTHNSTDYDWKEVELKISKPLRVYSLIKVECSISHALSLEAKRRRTTVERLANRILREKLKVA